MQRTKARCRGKTILITGASYGIGEALAYMLAGSGAKLLLVARTAEKLQQVQQEVEQRGGTAQVFSTDLSKSDHVEMLLAQLMEMPGGIDMVVSNAGHSIRRSLHDSLDRHHDLSRTMAINYFGPTQLLMALVPMLEKNRGHIINVSAVNVLLAPAPHWGAYQASKAAFDNWFRCAAPELNAAGVATTSIYLPLVRTRMTEPTALYTKMPAMSAGHAARKICYAICSRKKTIKPWWLIWGQLGSVLFRGLWERLATGYLKRRPYDQ